MKLFENIRSSIGNWSKRGQYNDAFYRGDALGALWSPRRTILGADMTESKSMAVPAVYCCVRAIVDGIASMPVKLVQDMPDGKVRQAKELDEYWLFVERPNPEDTPREFLESYLISLLLRGNGYAHTWRNNRGRCTEIRYLEPDLVSISRVKGTLVYRGSDMTTGQSLTLFQGDGMLHTKRFKRDTWSGLGLSPLGYHRETFALALSQQEFSASIYSEGVVPKGILASDQDLDDPQMKKIAKKWHEKNGGAKNAGRTPILPLGIKYQSIGMTPEEAKMVENFGYTERQIAQIYGCSLYVLYNFKDIKFSTNEQQQIDFVTNTLRPWIEIIEDSFTRNILTSPQIRAGYRYEIDEEAFYRGATKDMHETFAVDIQNGIKSRNEVRIEIGLPPVEGGDDLLLPANSVTQKEKNMQIEASEKALEDPQVEAAEGAADPQSDDDQAANDKKAQDNGGDKPKQKGVSNNPAGSVKKRSKAEEALLGNVRDAIDRVISKERKLHDKHGNSPEFVAALGDHEAYIKNVLRSSVKNALSAYTEEKEAEALAELWLISESEQHCVRMAFRMDLNSYNDTAPEFLIDSLLKVIDNLENSTHG